MFTPPRLVPNTTHRQSNWTQPNHSPSTVPSGGLFRITRLPVGIRNLVPLSPFWNTALPSVGPDIQPGPATAGPPTGRPLTDQQIPPATGPMRRPYQGNKRARSLRRGVPPPRPSVTEVDETGTNGLQSLPFYDEIRNFTAEDDEDRGFLRELHKMARIKTVQDNLFREGEAVARAAAPKRRAEAMARLRGAKLKVIYGEEGRAEDYRETEQESQEKRLAEERRQHEEEARRGRLRNIDYMMQATERRALEAEAKRIQREQECVREERERTRKKLERERKRLHIDRQMVQLEQKRLQEERTQWEQELEQARALYHQMREQYDRGQLERECLRQTLAQEQAQRAELCQVLNLRQEERDYLLQKLAEDEARHHEMLQEILRQQQEQEHLARRLATEEAQRKEMVQHLREQQKRERLSQEKHEQERLHEERREQEPLHEEQERTHQEPQEQLWEQECHRQQGELHARIEHEFLYQQEYQVQYYPDYNAESPMPEDPFQRYEWKWDRLKNAKGYQIPFFYFPWPVFHLTSEPTGITTENVIPFLSALWNVTALSQAEIICKVKKELNRWHPDKLGPPFMLQVAEEDRYKVQEAALVVSKILTANLTPPESK